MTGRAHQEMQTAQQTCGGSASHGMSNNPNQPKAGPSDHKTRENKSFHDANNPLLTVDAGNRPCGASPPHEGAGQSSERVVASAPWLRRQVDDMNPQEHEEPQACDSSDAPKARGDLQTHVSSKVMQGTPLVVPDMCCPTMDNVGITATSHGSGVERMVQQEYCSVMSRDESPTPGPRATFPQVGQPSAKGKEQAADEQPASSAKRRINQTWLKRAMERMEHRLQVMIHSSLDPVLHNMSDLKAHVMAIEERVTPHEEYEQEDDSPLDSGQWRDSLAEPYLGFSMGTVSPTVLSPRCRWLWVQCGMAPTVQPSPTKNPGVVPTPAASLDDIIHKLYDLIHNIALPKTKTAKQLPSRLRLCMPHAVLLHLCTRLYPLLTSKTWF